MKRLLLRALVVGLPVLAISAIALLIDPFGYFSRDAKLDSERSIAQTLNPCMEKLLQFKRAPTPGILLGDSRMQSLDEDEISLLTEYAHTDLAYGGASLKEIVDSFWEATRVTELKSVSIGLNFALYSDYNITYRTETLASIGSNPLLYLTNRTVLHATWLVLKQRMGFSVALGTPTVTRDVFWEQNLAVLRRYYDHYLPPTNYRRQLQEISRFAREHSIQLRFIVFPTHMDGQRLVSESGLDMEYAQFKADLRMLGETFDFDVSSPITRDDDNYKDPIHFKESIAGEIISEVYGPEGEALSTPGRPSFNRH